MLANKQHELETGKAFVCISHCDEYNLKTRFKNFEQSLKEMPQKIAHIVVFMAVKQGVRIFEKTKKIVYPKISHIVDAVKGKDIPKNKGSVSLFLKHIENFRDID